MRPTGLTELHRAAASAAHLHPLVTATRAENEKHRTYDLECAKHGWKLVPFAMESLGAKGSEASQLLERMSHHCVDRTPKEFLLHAERLLSVCLQTGNAQVSCHGTADLLLSAVRRGHSGDGPIHSYGARVGRNQQKRAANITATSLRQRAPFSSIVHESYRSSRERAA